MPLPLFQVDAFTGRPFFWQPGCCCGKSVSRSPIRLCITGNLPPASPRAWYVFSQYGDPLAERESAQFTLLVRRSGAGDDHRGQLAQGANDPLRVRR